MISPQHNEGTSTDLQYLRQLETLKRLLQQRVDQVNHQVVQGEQYLKTTQAEATLVQQALTEIRQLQKEVEDLSHQLEGKEKNVAELHQVVLAAVEQIGGSEHLKKLQQQYQIVKQGSVSAQQSLQQFKENFKQYSQSFHTYIQQQKADVDTKISRLEGQQQEIAQLVQQGNTQVAEIQRIQTELGNLEARIRQQVTQQEQLRNTVLSAVAEIGGSQGLKDLHNTVQEAGEIFKRIQQQGQGLDQKIEAAQRQLQNLVKESRQGLTRQSDELQNLAQQELNQFRVLVNETNQGIRQQREEFGQEAQEVRQQLQSLKDQGLLLSVQQQQEKIQQQFQSEIIQLKKRQKVSSQQLISLASGSLVAFLLIASGLSWVVALPLGIGTFLIALVIFRLNLA